MSNPRLSFITWPFALLLFSSAFPPIAAANHRIIGITRVSASLGVHHLLDNYAAFCFTEFAIAIPFRIQIANIDLLLITQWWDYLSASIHFGTAHTLPLFVLGLVSTTKDRHMLRKLYKYALY
ncbi:hypothetical protein BT63DRAFT_231927 [Microthyrium microscopicum]|uniref:Uncharacterized protein n=1 Tax=Microthyrium microscopicum TaxID=703497 RepID=A0A6A6UF03_9PEZI|nr:hypothetical protein BT63DRAFT_231927 [Microthyrium microscopicum]